MASSVNTKVASKQAKAAFATVVAVIGESPVFSGDGEKQYVVQEPDDSGVLTTKSFATELDARKYCNSHVDAEYYGHRPLETLLVV